MIEQNLFEHLKANVPEVSERVYAYLLPLDSALPALVYFLVSAVPDYDMNGECGEQSRYQVSVYADSYAEVKAVTQSVKDAMNLPIAGVQAAFRSNCSDAYEDAPERLRTDLDYLLYS